MHPISQLLIFGFQGTALTEPSKNFITQAHPGGFIFFEDNCLSLDQVSELVHSIDEFYREIHGHAPWLCIDHENRTVQRLPSPLTQFPDAHTLGKLLNPTTATLMGRTMGKELHDLGFNLNFSPVCDVATQYTPNYLKDRCFSNHSETISTLVEHFIPALQKEGVGGCAKHFPGLGSADSDPHQEAVQTQQPLETFRQKDWRVFSHAIDAGVVSIMTTHVLCPSLDPHYMATYSQTIIQKYLVKELKFQGLVISDDLKMGAVKETPDKAVFDALQAGHHLMIFSPRNAQVHLALLEKLAQEIKHRPQLSTHIEKSCQKSQVVLKQITLKGQ